MKTYENGALAQDALDEMVIDFDLKVCHQSMGKASGISLCKGSKCTAFNEGEITKSIDTRGMDVTEERYVITIKPHCGLIKTLIKRSNK